MTWGQYDNPSQTETGCLKPLLYVAIVLTLFVFVGSCLLVDRDTHDTVNDTCTASGCEH